MSLKPVQPEEQVQKACQLCLTVLTSPDTRIPGNLGDGIQSFKALLNGVIQGNLFICQVEPPVEVDPTSQAEAGDPAVVDAPAPAKKIGKKKVASKKA